MTRGVGYSGTRDPNIAGVSSSGVSGSGVIATISSGLPPGTIATLNPSDKSSLITLSGGNLVATHGAGTTWGSVRATVGKSSGKLYYEVTINATRSDPNNNVDPVMGISLLTYPTNTFPGASASYVGYGLQDKAPTAQKFSPGASTAYVAYSGSAGTRYGIYVDLAARTISYSFGGVDKGVATSNITVGEYYPTIWMQDTGATNPVVTCYFDPATWVHADTYPAASGWIA